MSKNETYTLTGNTYPHRDAIKSIGGTWDADRKCWTVKAGTMRARGNQSLVISRLQRAGVIVK